MSYLKRVLVVLILCCMSILIWAESTYSVQSAIENATVYYYDTPYANKAFSAISDAQVYSCTKALELYDGTIPFQSSLIFVEKGDVLIPFTNHITLCTSDDFVSLIKDDYRLIDDQDAYIFQSFLYLIDNNFFHEGFFQDGLTWYFIRDEFFGDIEAWIVHTDEEGRIVSIVHEYEIDIELPQEMKEIANQDRFRNYSVEIPESVITYMHQQLSDTLVYEMMVTPFEHESLDIVWNAQWYTVELSTVEYYDGYPYTTTMNVVACAPDDDIFLFGSVDSALSSIEVLEAINNDFVLSSEEDVQLLQEVLDIIAMNESSEKSHFFRNGNWYIIRDTWHDDGEGWVVSVDDEGHILSLYYDYYIPLHEEVVEVEEFFDESLVDWTIHLLEPKMSPYTVKAGDGVPVAIEFDAFAASKVGAWMMTLLNGEFSGMQYTSEGISSPYYDWISYDELPVGTHTLSYLLMRPGSDIEQALDRVDIDVIVLPFDATGVDWKLRLLSPHATRITAKEGVSIPLRVEFNDDATTEHGVNLVLRHQGEIVGGQHSRYLQSPFETTIPGSVLTSGFHLVDVFLVPPGSGEQGPLALLSITIWVE